MATYHITVLGAGKIGGTLERKFVAAGHQVTFGVSNPAGEKAQALRNELGNNVTIGTVAAVITAADVVVCVIPVGVMEATIAANAAALNGKVIIDATNRMGNATANSLAAFQQHTPQASVYRAFNTMNQGEPQSMPSGSSRHFVYSPSQLPLSTYASCSCTR